MGRASLTNPQGPIWGGDHEKQGRAKVVKDRGLESRACYF